MEINNEIDLTVYAGLANLFPFCDATIILSAVFYRYLCDGPEQCNVVKEN